MDKGFKIISRDGGKKTQRIELELEGRKKAVTIKDHGDETENLRAFCRELKKFEDTLKIN